MKYRVRLLKGEIKEFENENDALSFAKENAIKLHKVLGIDYNDGSHWRILGIAYPSGTIQIGTKGFGMFK